MHTITDKLLVGNLEDARQPPSSIGGLLFLAEEYQVTPPRHIVFCEIPLKEFSEADPAALKRAVEWLEAYASSKRLLVCCRAGMGRSVSVVIAFLCCVVGMRYQEAVLFVKARRPGATPLPGLEETVKRVQLLRSVNQDQATKPCFPATET